jgi:hypothetical protein
MATIDDLMRYQYAPLAAAAVEQENFVAAGISLEKLAGDMNCAKDIRPYIDGALASKEGIKLASNGFLSRYDKAYKTATIGDLWTIYQNADLTDGEKSLYGSRINPLKDKKLEDVKKMIKEKEKRLKSVLDGNETMPEGEMLLLSNELRNYKEALSVISGLEQYNIVSLNEPVQKEAIKRQKKYIKDSIRDNVLQFNTITTPEQYRMAA